MPPRLRSRREGPSKSPQTRGDVHDVADRRELDDEDSPDGLQPHGLQKKDHQDTTDGWAPAAARRAASA